MNRLQPASALRADAASRLGGPARSEVVVGLLAHAAVPFMTRSSTPCSSISVAGRVWTTRPSEMTRTRSARPRTSSISLETTTIGVAGCGEAADEGVDLGASADVDAAGGLVEQQHPRAVHEPAGEQDLLLVAAGERSGGAVGVGRSQLERLDLLARGLALGALVEEAGLARSGRTIDRVTLTKIGSSSTRPWLLRSSGEARSRRPRPRRPSRGRSVLPPHRHAFRRSPCARRRRSRGSRIGRSRPARRARRPRRRAP